MVDWSTMCVQRLSFFEILGSHGCGIVQRNRRVLRNSRFLDVQFLGTQEFHANFWSLDRSTILTVLFLGQTDLFPFNPLVINWDIDRNVWRLSSQFRSTKILLHPRFLFSNSPLWSNPGEGGEDPAASPSSSKNPRQTKSPQVLRWTNLNKLVPKSREQRSEKWLGDLLHRCLHSKTVLSRAKIEQRKACKRKCKRENSLANSVRSSLRGQKGGTRRVD